MCEAVSLSVVRLKRARYGNLDLNGLNPGQYRMLSEIEIQGLLSGKTAPREEKRGNVKRIIKK
jgi:23S rRNA pseudouridine2605 synthase